MQLVANKYILTFVCVCARVRAEDLRVSYRFRKLGLFKSGVDYFTLHISFTSVPLHKLWYG